MKKKNCLIIVTLFLFQLCVHSIFIFFQEKESFSEEENRLLAIFPLISSQEYFSGNFAKQFETYIDDHFPFKYLYIDMSRKISSLYYFNGFAVSDDMIILSSANNIEQAFYAKDIPAGNIGSIGFETEELQGPAEDESPPPTPGGLMIIQNQLAESFTASDWHISKYAEAVNKLYEECGKPETYVILPPSAAQLYMPDRYRNDENNQYNAFDKLKAKLSGPQYIDLRNTFEKHKDEYLYFKTDHHWTALAAYYAYETFINELGMTPTKLGDYESGKRSGFKGSLFRILAAYPQYEAFKDASDDVYYYIPKNSAKVFSYRNINLIDGEERQLIYFDYEENNLYNMFMGGDIPIGYIHSSIGNGKSIMVVRDSYGHVFLPYLVDNFEYIYSVDPRHFNKNMALGEFFKEKQIDTLLFLSYSLTATSSHWLVWGDELLKISK